MAFDTYIFIDTIEGESGATFSPAPPNAPAGKPSEIFSFSFGASNPSTVGSGSAGLSAGKVSVSSFNFMKKSDNASPLLFEACATGQHIAKASVVLRKAAGKDNKQAIFLQYDFTSLLVESIQWSGSSGGDDTPTESVSIAFAKIEITNYIQATVGGALSKGTGASWDVTKVV